MHAARKNTVLIETQGAGGRFGPSPGNSGQLGRLALPPGEASSVILRGIRYTSYALIVIHHGRLDSPPSICVDSKGGGLQMRKTLGILLVFAGCAGTLLARPVPEVDPGSSLSALALLSGALLVLRSKRKR